MATNPGLSFPKEMDCEPAPQSLRIAIVYSRLPLPMHFADQMTVAHLMAFLKKRGHSIDLYTLEAGGKMTPENDAWIKAICNKVNIYKMGALQVMWGLLSTIPRLMPFQVGLFLHRQQIADLHAATERGEYDIVYTYYFRSAEVARGLGVERNQKYTGKKPVTYLAMQLSQALNTRRIYENAPNLANKILYFFESKLVARYETRIWKYFTKSILIGPKDVESIKDLCRMNNQPEVDNFIYGAHGTDVTRFRPRTDIAEIKDRLVFSGVMRTPTNVNAALWFVENVWPLVRAQRPEATFEIVGRTPTKEIIVLDKTNGIIVAGTVADPSVHIAAAAICVNPMQAGGGMQNKLIEFLGSGKAIVATSVANEGIRAESGKHLMICDDPKDMAENIVNLLKDTQRREALGRAAREYVLENWTWEAHWLKLESDFLASVNGS
jgi:polysaccharide biosynthesis protein PslH